MALRHRMALKEIEVISVWRTKDESDSMPLAIEDRKFDATILAARKLSELEAQGLTRPCPAREIIITDAISKAEEIMRKIEKNYPAK